MGQPEGQVQYYTREQVLSGSSTSGVPSLSATDISFVSQDNSIRSVSTNFVTALYAAGMQIAITGSALNNIVGLIKEVYANKLIMIDCVIAPESAGASISIAPNYILAANVGNSDRQLNFERCYICCICNQSFPERLMRLFRGRYYCVPNDDYKDIASILKREAAAGYRPAGLGVNDKVIPPIIKG
jgi:hypothetical protein